MGETAYPGHPAHPKWRHRGQGGSPRATRRNESVPAAFFFIFGVFDFGYDSNCFIFSSLLNVADTLAVDMAAGWAGGEGFNPVVTAIAIVEQIGRSAMTEGGAFF